MPRSLASLTLAFGLVAIPVRLFAVTKRGAALRFRWMTSEGDAVRQRLVAEPALQREVEPDQANARTPMPAEAREATPVLPPAEVAFGEPAGRRLGWPANLPPAGEVEGEDSESTEPSDSAEKERVRRTDLQKGLEVEPGRFVLFTQSELDALATPRRDSIDLVAFVPPHAVDPMYVDKSYYLAPVKRAERPYALLLRALQQTRRCALAKWAWRGREHPALLRPGDGVLVLHQLQSGDAVRDASELEVELPETSDTELQLAVQLIEQSSTETFNPMDHIDPARQRILEAAHRKLTGGAVFETPKPSAAAQGGDSAEIIDLVAALKASLTKPTPAARKPPRRSAVPAVTRRRAGGTPSRGQ
jgi:DNA end-binding protein Ku